MSLQKFLLLGSAPSSGDTSKGSKGPCTTLSFSPCNTEGSAMASCSCTSSRYAGGELRDLVFLVNKRSQDRRSGSLMNCMLKQIHSLPVAWLYTGTWFFNGDGKQTFWQNWILLRAIYVLFSLKNHDRICFWIEKSQLCWDVIELSLILRCSWRQVFHAVSCCGGERSPVRC